MKFDEWDPDVDSFFVGTIAMMMICASSASILTIIWIIGVFAGWWLPF